MAVKGELVVCRLDVPDDGWCNAAAKATGRLAEDKYAGLKARRNAEENTLAMFGDL
jgi:hypothetical protein